MFGYALVAQKKLDEAIAIFKTQRQGASAVVEHLRQPGRGATRPRATRPAAVENYTRALSMVKDDVNKKRITDTLSKLKN